uniref:Uncharacterized protein n=1 Tax=Octopus bimaculoides TaxID=37653 RepID=A0A0L8HRP2_OCTBM
MHESIHRSIDPISLPTKLTQTLAEQSHYILQQIVNTTDLLQLFETVVYRSCPADGNNSFKICHEIFKSWDKTPYESELNSSKSSEFQKIEVISIPTKCITYLEVVTVTSSHVSKIICLKF